jgi:MFS family permease
MDTLPPPKDSFASLRIPEFRFWLASSGFSTLASGALTVALGYQIYMLTRNPMALGILGLVEAIPAVGLALFGGHAADRYNKRTIILVTRFVSVLAALCFVALSLNIEHTTLIEIYAAVFIAGVARSFSDPAMSVLEMQIVPRELFINASTWGSSMWQATAIIGPALGGFCYAWFGATNTYALIAMLYFCAWLSIARVSHKPTLHESPHESMWASIKIGIHYVFNNKPLVGMMSLDLFAVLFGGTMALLPIFASDILKVGPHGLGLLVAAPSVGALISIYWSTHFPPMKQAGKILFAAVAGFGVSIIVFALSKNFYLSLFALLMSGVCDGISVVIRKAAIRLLSPAHLRGRIAAVSLVFIGSSNELGALESGVAASLLGTIPAVWIGGVVTLLVVGFTRKMIPELNTLDLTKAVPQK